MGLRKAVTKQNRRKRPRAPARTGSDGPQPNGPLACPPPSAIRPARAARGCPGAHAVELRSSFPEAASAVGRGDAGSTSWERVGPHWERQSGRREGTWAVPGAASTERSPLVPSSSRSPAETEASVLCGRRVAGLPCLLSAPASPALPSRRAVQGRAGPRGALQGVARLAGRN